MTMTHNPTATATVETITPAIAEEMLTRNHGNRPLREGRAEALAAAMVRGEWKLNGETIKIARDGRVLDGQHRLWAIVLAERPIETFVIRGLEGDVFTTIDVGAKRTVSDMLATSGHVSTRCLAAAATILYRHDRGLWTGYHGTNAPTPDQLLELVAFRAAANRMRPRGEPHGPIRSDATGPSCRVAW